jgi:putative holliday junction resolvase
MKKKYLGIDWGKKRIGLALADEETKLALPFKTVDNMSAVLVVIKQEGITDIILGQPIKLSGQSVITDKDYLYFLKILQEKTKLEVNVIDERFSTKEGISLSGRKKDKADIDSLSACIILQSYLDKLEL